MFGGELNRRNVLDGTNGKNQFDEVQLESDDQTMKQQQQGMIYNTYQYSPNLITNTSNNMYTSIPSSTKSLNSGSTFLYNKRVIPILIISMIPVLTLAGRYSLFLLLLGLKAMYALDFLQQKAYAFIIFWTSLCLFWTSIYTTSLSLVFVSVVNIFVLLNGSLFVIIFGTWASLQSEWFKSFIPEIVFACERLLFAALPLVSLPLVISVVVGLVGIGNSAFYLVFLLCLYVHWFGKREVSSFSKNRYIQRTGETGLLIILLILLPPAMHIAVYHNSLTSYDEDFWSHIYTILALFATSIMFLSINPAEYLWPFAYGAASIHSPSQKPVTPFIDLTNDTHNTARYFVQILCSVLFNGWIEFRVILPRYHHLIPLPSPWDKIAVFSALNSITSVALLIVYNQHNIKTNKSTVSKILLSVLLCIGGFFGAIVLGFPFYLIPFPVIAMFYAVEYFYNERFNEYLIFVGCALVSALWFMISHFWFLDFEFALTFLPIRIDWSLRMTHSTITIVLFLIVSLLTIPFVCKMDTKEQKGFLASFNVDIIRNVLLVTQAFLLAFLEQLLYEQEEGFYSSMLIILTTILGIVFTKTLFATQRVSINIASLLTSLYFSKLAIPLTQHGTYGSFISAVVSTLALSRLYYATITEDSEKTFSSNPISAIVYILMSGFTLFITRHILLQNILSLYIDTRFYDLNESHIFGFFLISWSLAILPLSLKFMKHSMFIKRFNLFLSIVGVIVAILQPSLAFLSFSDISSSTNSLGGASGFAGDFDSMKSTSESVFDYVPWIIIVSVLLLFSMDIISLREKTNPIIRAMSFGLIAAGFSVGFSGLYLYYTPIFVHLFLLIGMILASLVIYTTHFPVSHSYKTSLMLFLAFITTLPITYLSISIDESSLKDKHNYLKKESIHYSTYNFIISELKRSSSIAIIGLYTTLCALIAILIKFKLIGYPLIRVRKPGRTFTTRKVVQKEEEENMLSETQTTVEPGLSVPGSDELSVVNNGAVIVSFILCITLTTWLNPDRYEAYLLFCPIFLLLNRDSKLLSEFKDSMRFIVVLLAMELCIIMFFMIDSILFFSTAATSGQYSLDDVVSQYALVFLLVILTIPSHALFIRFLLRLHKPNLKPILIALPFSLISAVLTLVFGLYLDSFYSLIFITISAVGASILQAMISSQYVREQVILL